MLSQMTDHDLFKGIPSDAALYQNNKSQYLGYFFNNVLQHDHRYIKHPGQTHAFALALIP